MRKEVDSIKRKMEADKILDMTGLGEKMRQVEEYLKENPNFEREVMEAMMSGANDSKAGQKFMEEVQRIMDEPDREKKE
jgi:uncharacterized protein YneF (UPF0154 family)